MESCACKERGDCVQLEQIAGRVEVRALRCEWLRTGYRATCRFETRFVSTYGDVEQQPTPWLEERLTVRPSSEGGWCSIAGTRRGK